MPETSIIIVTYNGLHDTTAPCLDSIFKNSGGSDYEVIVVDNNSSDGTQDYLAELAGRELRLRFIANKTNRGFAGGNNDGIRASSGNFLVLLNSDCLVTPGWIEGLTGPLTGEPRIGLAGPVSNSVGNEQKIFTTGTTVEEIVKEGMAWVENGRGSLFDTDLLGFFCVAMRRDVLEKVGMLDENFGLGFYEDDDYCIRVKRAGYRLVCLEDVFVYHRGGGSFSKAGHDTRKLMKENRARLERKHGIRLPWDHPRLRQLRVIEGYCGTGAGSGAGTQYRISNRLTVVASQMPRGLFKRIAFHRRLRACKRRLRRAGFGV